MGGWIRCSAFVFVMEANLMSGDQQLKFTVKVMGGEGSGNRGHAGRPGEVGGSAPEGSGGSGGGGSISVRDERKIRFGIAAARDELEGVLGRLESGDSDPDFGGPSASNIAKVKRELNRVKETEKAINQDLKAGKLTPRLKEYL